MVTRVQAPENREDKLQKQTGDALASLRQLHSDIQQVRNTDARDLEQANAQLTTLAESVGKLHEIVGKLIRLQLGRFGDTEL